MGLYTATLEAASPASPAAGRSVLYPLSSSSGWYYKRADGTVLTLATLEGAGQTFQSPTFVTPALGTPASGNLANCTFPTLNQNTTGTAAGLSSTLVVASGGTGNVSATAYAVLCGGTTSTGAYQSIVSVGTTGQVLTSNGASALPTFQTPAQGGSFFMNQNFPTF